MLRVTADSNIYVSALNFPRGAPFHLLRIAQARQIRLDISDAILKETLGVLKRKFNFTDDDLREAESLIVEMTHRVTPTVTHDVVKADESDNRILECASEARSDVIVSGDKHLLRLKSHEGRPILKVNDFISRHSASQAPKQT